MMMSVGICECGCGEFDHEVGDASEEHDPDMDWEWRGHTHTVVTDELPREDGSSFTNYKVVNGRGVVMAWEDTLAEAERVAALLSEPSLQEEPPPDYENWQRHQCTQQCPSPCLVARCRDSFDGDGFWVWCGNCDIQCSGSWEAYSDEPQEEETNDTDEDEDEDEEPPEEYSEVASEQFASRWAPVDIGTQIRVDFSEENFVITDAVVLNEFEDLARLSTFRERPNEPQVRAFFATGVDGVEILVNLSEIIDVLA